MYLFGVVVRTLVAFGETILQCIHILAGVDCKKQPSSTTFLSGGFSKVADGSTHGTHIVDDASQLRVIIDVVKQVGYIAALDVKEFVLTETGILSHDIHICPSDAHHLTCGVHIQQGHWLLFPFFLVWKFLKHTHLECAQYLASSSSETDKNVICL